MAASICSCPVEVLHMILAAVDPTDLANLRLVSKQWRALSSKLFGLLKLCHPRFVLSPYSLQGLVDLTAHPILGPCVESVNIGSYRLKKHLVNTQPHQDSNHANAAALTQFRCEQTGVHVALLAQAFANLRDHGVTPMLGAFEDYIHFAPGNEVHNRGYGYDELYGPINIFRCGKTQVTQTLVDLIKSSLNADCAPSGVSITLKWDPSDCEAVIQHPGLYPLLRDLSIKKCGRLKSGKHWKATQISGHKPLNRHHLEIRDQGKHLRLIRVSIDEYEGSPLPPLEPDIFGPFVDACYHAQFQRITLIECDLGRSVSRFLKTHASCLRHLTLSSICFHDDAPEDAVNLLLILRDILALEKISLNHIIFMNRHSSFVIFNEDLDYQERMGSEQIFDLLDESIERVRTENVKRQRFEDDDDDDHDHDDGENNGEDNHREDEGEGENDDHDHDDYE